MAVLKMGVPNHKEQARNLHEQQAAQSRANEAAKAEAARRADGRLREQVEGELRAERDAIEADAKLTPAERTELRMRLLEHPPVPIKTLPRPRGWALMREDVIRGWKHQECEQRERDLDLPARRDKWDKQRAEIIATRDGELRDERERHAVAAAQIREGSDDDTLKLGDRP